jgi:DNA-binding FadR family transcriptional regulator
MLGEHSAIFERLIAGERQAARQELEDHLKRSVETNVRKLGALGQLPNSRRVPSLISAD